MRLTRILATCVSVVAGVLLLVPAGATAREGGVAVQKGLRNYAGPTCPGSGWNCTTADDVVQVSHKGGTNVFVCRDDECSVEQSGGRNVARCVQRSDEAGATLVCAIVQDGKRNRADVTQRIFQRDGSTQRGKEVAEVLQTASGGGNRARVNQDIRQFTHEVEVSGSLAEQTQLTDQSLLLSQEGSAGADNSARGDQSSRQVARAKARGVNFVLQRQNAGDLDFASPKNVHASITQASDEGMNTMDLSQSDTYRATARAAKAQITQRQGSENGGLDASADQNGVDVADAVVRQRTRQNAGAKTKGRVFQDQVAGDPKCCSSFIGDPALTTVRVDQRTDQRASEGAATQTALFFGLFHTNGDGLLVQTARMNDGRERIVTECSPGTCSSILVCGEPPEEDGGPGHENGDDEDDDEDDDDGENGDDGGGGGAGTVCVPAEGPPPES
jgi:hypothetical protein